MQSKPIKYPFQYFTFQKILEQCKPIRKVNTSRFAQHYSRYVKIHAKNKSKLKTYLIWVFGNNNSMIINEALQSTKKTKNFLMNIAKNELSLIRSVLTSFKIGIHQLRKDN